jgi:cytochrome c biogenesis factor
MEGGIFLLLCVLALFIGSRARNAKLKNLSEKQLRRKAKMTKGMVLAAFVLVVLFLLAYTPFVLREISIARDTHFSTESYLSLILWVFGFFTLYTIFKALKKSK